MSFLDIFKYKPKQVEDSKEDRSCNFGYALNYNGYSTYKTSLAMNLSAVHRAVDVITNCISSLPVKLYKVDSEGFKFEIKNNLSYMLSKKPNNKMTANTFYSLIVKDILLAGNAYALIKREDNKITGLIYIQPGYVNPIEKPDNIVYKISGVKKEVQAEDILHFMGYTENGVYGISVLSHARRTLGIADSGDTAAQNFYKSGSCTSGFLKFEGPSNNKQREEIMSAWQQATGGPNSGPNGIAVLPSNVSYTQLSVNPADAQLLESRKFEIIEIARFFNVPPSLLYDLEKASYNNSEQMYLTFLNDTIRPLITKIENELETKLFLTDSYDVKFDVSEMLRTDKTSQSEYFTKLFNLGVMSPNDIRKELDMTPVEGGDINVAQINLTSIKNLEFINNTADNRYKEPELIQNNQSEDDQKNTEE